MRRTRMGGKSAPDGDGTTGTQSETTRLPALWSECDADTGTNASEHRRWLCESFTNGDRWMGSGIRFYTERIERRRIAAVMLLVSVASGGGMTMRDLLAYVSVDAELWRGRS